MKTELREALSQALYDALNADNPSKKDYSKLSPEVRSLIEQCSEKVANKFIEKLCLSAFPNGIDSSLERRVAQQLYRISYLSLPWSAAKPEIQTMYEKEARAAALVFLEWMADLFELVKEEEKDGTDSQAE